MFWKKKPEEAQPKAEKLPGPMQIPQSVQRHLVAEHKMDPDLARILKAVVRRKGEKAFDVRIFDESETLVKKVVVKDYTTFDEHPDLILYEGWFDDESKRVELQEKKKVSYDVPLFSEAEIQQKIEALTEPGSTVFFYLARGPTYGGPLGRGAAVIELNPIYPAKRQKKYIIYTADVDGTQPVGKGTKLFASDKPKEIARWVKPAHHKRAY